MRKRCGMEEEYSEEDEEEETLELSMGDVNIFDYKPELYGKGIGFERLRRVTGYISSGDYRARMNNAKQAEVRDRRKHA